MPKHKTIKQKKIADFRRQLYSLKLKDAPFSSTIAVQYTPANTTILDTNIPSVFREITKTSIFVLIALFFQIILFMLLKAKVFSIPGLIY